MATRKYGAAYQGSKSKIADLIKTQHFTKQHNKILTKLYHVK